jgi:hypothetical protein
MFPVELFLAWQYPDVTTAIILVIALAAVLWIPYLYKEIRRGKATIGPSVPDGTGEPRTGRIGNPAPGQPDGQADPYNPRASR